MTDMIERVARAIGYGMASTVSGNNMPHMSGDPRDRIPPVRRKAFDRAVMLAASAAIAAMRECELVVRDDEGHVVHELRGAPNDIWQHMITAALSQDKGE